MRYLQRAASTPVTRLEVVALQERLDRALQERQVPKPWPYTNSYLECPPGHLKYLLAMVVRGSGWLASMHSSPAANSTAQPHQFQSAASPCCSAFMPPCTQTASLVLRSAVLIYCCAC